MNVKIKDRKYRIKNVNLLWSTFEYAWQNSRLMTKAILRNSTKNNINNKWSFSLILASLNSARTILQISRIVLDLHVDNDCDARDTTIAKTQTVLMIERKEFDDLSLWELEFTIDENYRL